MQRANGSTLFRSLEAHGRHIVERLGGEWRQGGGVCRCPGHDDHTPSLSVRPGERRLLFHCFAGCETRLFVPVDRAAEVLGRLSPE